MSLLLVLLLIIIIIINIIILGPVPKLIILDGADNMTNIAQVNETLTGYRVHPFISLQGNQIIP